MDVFILIIASYPVAVFTFLLLIVVVYWLIAILGLIDIDALDLPELDTDVELDSLEGLTGVAGFFIKLGFQGIPVMVILSLLTLIAWWTSYFCVWLLPFTLNGIWKLALGTAILIASFVFALLITRFLVIPLKPLFRKNTARSKKSFLGQAVVIRSSRVDEHFGQAELNDTGAGLILNVRAKSPNQIKKADRVILLEYLEKEHAYLVIPERDFY